MRIIGGEFGSRRLLTPKGSDTRPTLDATRESVFNILGVHVHGARVLDLFAGSGAMGLEAISRGAVFAAFVDVSQPACRIVTRNIVDLGVQDRCRVYGMSWTRALKSLRAMGTGFDLVFLDPPYALEVSPVFLALAAAGLMTEEARIVLERDKRMTATLPPELMLIRTKEYGDTRVDFLTYHGGQHGYSDLPRQL